MSEVNSTPYQPAFAAVVCKECGRSYRVPPRRLGLTKYCSKKCRHAADRKKTAWNKGLKLPYEVWNKGQTGVITTATRELMSRAKKGTRNNYRGGRRMHNGYVEIYSPTHPHRNANKCVAEHRLVMEKHLGRYLLSDEVVHHKNEIKTDNRIENLELFASHSEHAKNHGRHDKVENTDMHRQCYKCREVLPLTAEHFGRNRSYKHGFSYLCKPCARKKWRARQEARAVNSPPP